MMSRLRASSTWAASISDAATSPSPAAARHKPALRVRGERSGSNMAAPAAAAAVPPKAAIVEPAEYMA